MLPWPRRAARAGEGSAKENDRVVSDLMRSIDATKLQPPAELDGKHEHDVTDAN